MRRCNCKLLWRRISATSCCLVVSVPTTPSANNSAPSRSAVRGVFNSWDKWRRNRLFCSSKSSSRRRIQSRRSPSALKSWGPSTITGPDKSPCPMRRIAASIWRKGLAINMANPNTRKIATGNSANNCHCIIRSALLAISFIASTSRSIRALPMAEMRCAESASATKSLAAAPAASGVGALATCS